ncbi:MAG: sn-glycerol-1-phosphate dehydrogenase [Clostridia bacterium]|nr:sn-glycerol-1-phosphate dehydrogenase [Clostridia bacterium]
MNKMIHFADADLKTLIAPEGHACACGRTHSMVMDYVSICPGAVKEIPAGLKAIGGTKPFIVCDENTKAAAWPFVEPVLAAAGIQYSLYCFPGAHIEPDEQAMGSLAMAYDPSCDCIMGIGSGVINDCCKIMAKITGHKQMIVGTAPSMDGYASNSSAMIRDRIKVSIYDPSPAAIICDIDIIKNAPMRMLWAGFGDMLAKYIAICEWRISNLVTGEYYCENIADLMRASLRKIVENAPQLKTRDEKAVQATVEGLVLSGVAMSYAGISRPASGLEHYFSHLWEMMALDRGNSYELHGIQVGVGTLITLKLYDKIREMKPSREIAEKFINDFCDEEWQKMIRRIFGKAAETVIMQEHNQFHKNDKTRHAARLTKILENWDEILKIIDEELPDREAIAAIMKGLEMPMTPEDINISWEDTCDAFIGSRDIRDKYLSSSMLWDMGVLYTTELPK